MGSLTLLQKFTISFARWVMSWIGSPPIEGYIDFTFGPISDVPFNLEIPMATLVLNDSQQGTVSISPKSKAGNPAQVDGVPTWTCDTPDISVTPAPDGMSALVKSTGKIAAGVVTVSCDADLGDGVKTIQGSFNVSVDAGQAVDLGVAFGDVVDIPPDVPPTPEPEPPPA